MSDHGMTESLPFHHLYCQSLAQFIAEHGVNPPAAVELDPRPYKDLATLQQVEELSAEIGPRTSSATQFLVDRATRMAMRIGTGPLQAGLAEDLDSPVLAIYSSALANVYFTDLAHRASRADIDQLAPGLLSALVRHPGVGLVLIRENGKTTALHGRGQTVLEDATRNDLSFLQPYDDPEIVREQLIALAAMPSGGDLLVFGAYDGRMVVNFEDHVGAHGGLGGVQMFPFMVAPCSVGFPFEEVVDATELHEVFAQRYQLSGRAAPGPGRFVARSRRQPPVPDSAAG
jgi:hypothetical protein